MTTHTTRDLEIFRALVFAVRIIWEEQILRAWWPNTKSGRKNGQRRLREHSAAGILHRHVVHAKPVLNVALLYAGGPNEPAPDFGALARESKRRWQLPIQPIVVYTATRRTQAILGGLDRHRVHALPQLSHDLGTAALYVDVLLQDPTLAGFWRSEDEMLLRAEFGDSQPDAVLIDASGRPVTALEFAADYEPKRFAKLHTTFVDQHLSYRIYGAEP